MYIVQKVYIASLGALYTYSCGGTLINRDTVLTAAHCINTEVTDDAYTYTVTTNSYYPTFESMFTVYLGVYDNSFVKYKTTPDSAVVTASVKYIIRVTV